MTEPVSVAARLPEASENWIIGGLGEPPAVTSSVAPRAIRGKQPMNTTTASEGKPHAQTDHALRAAFVVGSVKL